MVIKMKKTKSQMNNTNNTVSVDVLGRDLRGTIFWTGIAVGVVTFLALVQRYFF
jgi:hypothetical protein